MNVQVFAKQEGQDFSEDLYDQLDKAELRESLQSRLIDDNLDFKYAIVTYDGEHTHRFDDLQSLLDELGKMGV